MLDFMHTSLFWFLFPQMEKFSSALEQDIHWTIINDRPGDWDMNKYLTLRTLVFHHSIIDASSYYPNYITFPKCTRKGNQNGFSSSVNFLFIDFTYVHVIIFFLLTKRKIEEKQLKEIHPNKNPFAWLHLKKGGKEIRETSVERNNSLPWYCMWIDHKVLLASTSVPCTWLSGFLNIVPSPE